MNKKIMSPSESMTVAANIQKIEFHLGGPIPGGMIDMSDYSDHILSPDEVATIVTNIRKVHRTPITGIEEVCMYGFFILFVILFIYDKIFG